MHQILHGLFYIIWVQLLRLVFYIPLGGFDRFITLLFEVKEKGIFIPSAVNHRSGVCFSCFQPQRWRVFITWIKKKRVITVNISFKASLSVCLRLWINCLKFWAHSCSLCVRLIINDSYSLWLFWRGLWQGIQRVPTWHINIINSHMQYVFA